MPPLAILAGGLATRLRPLTGKIPKSMVEVAGEPFIAHQLRIAAREGIRDVVICAGHLGGQIETFVGNGARFGCRVRFSFDGESPRGTGGALRHALPLLGDRCMVMYGDSYLDTDFRAVHGAFIAAGRPALMTVCRNEGRWDTSNVEFTGGKLVTYDKTDRTSAMRHIDYGLGAIETKAVREWPAPDPFDLADVYRDLSRRGMLAGCEIRERFYEIGSPGGLAETDAFIRGHGIK